MQNSPSGTYRIKQRPLGVGDRPNRIDSASGSKVTILFNVISNVKIYPYEVFDYL